MNKSPKTVKSLLFWEIKELNSSVSKWKQKESFLEPRIVPRNPRSFVSEHGSRERVGEVFCGVVRYRKNQPGFDSPNSPSRRLHFTSLTSNSNKGRIWNYPYVLWYCVQVSSKRLQFTFSENATFAFCHLPFACQRRYIAIFVAMNIHVFFTT